MDYTWVIFLLLKKRYVKRIDTRARNQITVEIKALINAVKSGNNKYTMLYQGLILRFSQQL